MGAAMRHRSKQDWAANSECGGPVAGEELRGNMTLVVQHHNKGVDPGPVEDCIRAKWTADRKALLFRRIDRGLDDLALFIAEQPAFAGMRIEPAHRDPWPRDANLSERAVGYLDGTQHPLLRNERDSLTYA